jgi:FKBP-type peptidyl-prolyl cis-trans isomerase
MKHSLPRFVSRLSLGAFAAFGLIGLALISGCSKEKPATVAEDAKASAYRMSAADEQLVKSKFPDAQSSPTGLRWIVRKPGTGTATPKYGAVVTIDYDLRLVDGTQLETSLKSIGGPLVVQIGLGRVIKAWDEAVLDMKKGERRTLIVPHWLGYGVTGNPPKIPPYATLVFELELLDFR